MNKTLELREKRSKAWEAAKAFLDTKRGNDGLLSADDTATYEKMEADVLALGREIERLERQASIDAELATAVSTPIKNPPSKDDGGNGKVIRATNEYKRDFFAVMRGRHVTNLLQESVDADGGYLVPIEFETSIVEKLYEDNVMRRIAKVITTSAERKVPIAATPSVATWVPENGTIPESTVTFDQKTLDAFKITDLVKVSVELLQDSMFNLETYLASEFARAIGVAEEQAFLTGSGNGQPTGLFNATGGADVGVTSSGTSISFDDIISLVYSLKSPYRRNAVFLMNEATVAMIRKVKDTNGAYMWQASLTQGQPDRLLGYPLYTSPYAPEVAAGANAVAFGDMSNYWIADRTGRTMQRMNELYSLNGQVGFLATARVDGKVILAEGIKLLQLGGGTP